MAIFPQNSKSIFARSIELYSQGYGLSEINNQRQAASLINYVGTQVDFSKVMDSLTKKALSQPVEEVVACLVVHEEAAFVRCPDGVYCNSVFVVIGVDASGRKNCLGVWEFRDTWQSPLQEILENLGRRGLRYIDFLYYPRWGGGERLSGTGVNFNRVSSLFHFVLQLTERECFRVSWKNRVLLEEYVLLRGEGSYAKLIYTRLLNLMGEKDGVDSEVMDLVLKEIRAVRLPSFELMKIFRLIRSVAELSIRLRIMTRRVGVFNSSEDIRSRFLVAVMCWCRSALDHVSTSNILREVV